MLAEVGGDAEGDGGRRIQGLGLDGPGDDARLQVGAEAHHRRDHQRGGDAETRPQGSHARLRYRGRAVGGRAAAVWPSGAPRARGAVEKSRDSQRLGPGRGWGPRGTALALSRSDEPAAFETARRHTPRRAGRRERGPRPGAPGPGALAPCSSHQTATGTLTAYDPVTRVLTVRSATGSREFLVAEDARIWLGNRRLPVSQLGAHAGAQVTVAWSRTDSVRTTHTVRVTDTRAAGAR